MRFIQKLASSSLWKGTSPATEVQVAKLVQALGVPLPPSVIQFFRSFNGGEGRVNSWNMPLRIMSAEEIPNFQTTWSVVQALPGHILIGSDCGDFGLLLDTTGGLVEGEYPIVFCPISSLGPEDARPLVQTFPRLFDVTQV